MIFVVHKNMKIGPCYVYLYKEEIQMHVPYKKKEIHQSKDLYGIDFHRFLELQSILNHMEIAQELGITLGEVHLLKKKIERT